MNGIKRERLRGGCRKFSRCKHQTMRSSATKCSPGADSVKIQDKDYSVVFQLP